MCIERIYAYCFYILYRFWKWKIRKAAKISSHPIQNGATAGKGNIQTRLADEQNAEQKIHFANSPLDKQGYFFLNIFQKHAWYKKSFDHRGQNASGKEINTCEK